MGYKSRLATKSSVLDLSHDEAVLWAAQVVSATNKQRVVDAFIASLGSQRTDIRSALGSFAALRHFGRHAFTPSTCFHPADCAECGLPKQLRVDVEQLAKTRLEQNSLIRFYDVRYAAFDLDTFNSLEWSLPSEEARETLRSVLTALRALPKSATLSALDGALKGRLKSNRKQRGYILEALGVCGILCPERIPSFFKAWVWRDEYESNSPSSFYARDSAYPLQHWTGQAGINEAALHWWFPML